MDVVAWVVAGLIGGWLAGASMKSGAYGRLGDLAVGLVGAFAGAWVFVFVAPGDMANGISWAVGVAVVTAAAFVAVARLVTRRAVPV